MVKYGITQSSERPLDVEITDEKVFVATDIEEVVVDEETVFQFNYTEYDKDEYIASQSQDIEDIQMALCEAYELLA